MKGFFVIDQEDSDFDLSDLLNIPVSVLVGTNDVPLVTLDQDQWEKLKKWARR